MERKQSLNRIEFCLAILCSTYYILPSVSAKISAMMFLAACLAYIGYCCFLDGMKLEKETLKYALIIILISLLYSMLTDTKTISADAANRDVKSFFSKVYQLGVSFFPLVIFKRFTRQASLFQKKFLLGSSAVLFSYVVVNTTKELLINPNITRSWAGFAESAASDIGSYALVYAVPFLIVLCGTICLTSHKAYVKIGMVLLIVFQFFFLLLAQYTLAVLITICGLVYAGYCCTERRKDRVVWLLLIVVLIPLTPMILKFAADHVPSNQMSIRLYEVYHFLIGDDTIGYNMRGRIELYTGSIKAFLRSPIIGNRSLAFDGHATFLTVLSDLGLLGGIPYFYLYTHSYKRARNMLRVKSNDYKPFFIMLLLMGFTNPIHSAFALMYAFWLIVPLTIQVREECLNGERNT